MIYCLSLFDPPDNCQTCSNGCSYQELYSPTSSCSQACNVSQCGYNYLSCLNIDNCYSFMLNDNNCNKMCSNDPDCTNSNDICAPGCYYSDMANGLCLAGCTGSCFSNCSALYCSPGCLWSDLHNGNCNIQCISECMNSCSSSSHSSNNSSTMAS